MTIRNFGFNPSENPDSRYFSPNNAIIRNPPRLQLVTEEGDEPVSLATMKLYLRVEDDANAEDATITAMVTAARRAIERYLSRALTKQTFDCWLDQPPVQAHLDLPRIPLISVTSVKTYDTTNTATTMSASDYTVDDAKETPRIFLNDGKTWPKGTRRYNGFVVRYICGHDANNPVPAPIVEAIKRTAAAWFEHREEMSSQDTRELTDGVKAMLQSYRAVDIR